MSFVIKLHKQELEIENSQNVEQRHKKRIFFNDSKNIKN